MEDIGIRYVVEGEEQFQKALDNGTQAIESFEGAAAKGGSAFEGFATVVTGALLYIGKLAVDTLLAAGRAVSGFVREAFGGALDDQRLLAQTEAVIKSTGQAAGFTAEQIKEMSEGFDAAIDPGEIQRMQNVLLTFTNIAGREFEDASQAILDMSVALGVDLQSSAIQVGKALNDPKQGISALQRVGVSFSESQKEVIQAMVDTGDVAGAQRLIIEELAREFGGSAAAAADTLGGKFDRLRIRIAEAAEGVAEKLIPIVTDLFDKYIEPNLPLLDAFADWLGDQIPAAVDWLARKFDEAKPYLDVLLASVRYVVDAFLDDFPLMRAEGEKLVAQLQQGFGVELKRLFHNLIEVWDMVAKFWNKYGEDIIRTTSRAFSIIIGIGQYFAEVFGGQFSALLHVLQGDWEGAWEIMAGSQERQLSIIENILGVSLGSLVMRLKNWWVEFYAAWLQRWLDLKNGINNLWVNLKNHAIDLWNRIGDALRDKADDIALAVRNGIQTAYDWARYWWGKIAAIFTDPAARQQMIQNAVNWVQGFIDGLWQKAQQLWSAVTSIWNSVVQKVKDILGIHSPSALGLELGANFGLAFGAGLRDALAGVGLEAFASVAAPAGAAGGGYVYSPSSASSLTQNLTINSPAPANIGMGFAMAAALASGTA